MIWVINSNSNTCKIYQYHKPTSKLDLLKQIQHPDAKLRSSELGSDRPGHYNGSGSARGAYSPEHEPKDIVIDAFLRDVARELNAERNKKSYERLILISPAHANGILMQHMDKHVKDLIISNIHKDLLHLNERELLGILEETPNY